MMGEQGETLEPPDEVEHHARRLVEDLAPEPQVRAIREFELIGSDLRLTRQLRCLLGLGLRFWGLLYRAQQRAGREVINTIFTLHQWLGHGPEGVTASAEAEKELLPFEAWIKELRGDPAYRAMLINWVEIFSERLGMHRYSNRSHLRRHARALVTTPICLAVSAVTKGSVQEAEAEKLTDFAEILLRFHDASWAEWHAELGWNRLLMGEAAQLGGFYGLADQARIPTEAEIMAAAVEIRNELDNMPAPTVHAALDPWLKVVREVLLKSLDYWINTGRWWVSPRPRRERFWQERIKDYFLKRP